MNTLKSKAVSIKGKKYVLVSDRVLYFNDKYPNGSIETDIYRYEGGQVIIQAIVTPDHSEPQRVFTGCAQEIEGDGYINKTSALENAETSAVGRALAMMGIGVIDSIASVDEINKANNRSTAGPKPWYNAFQSDRPKMLEKIGSGDKTPESIVSSLEERFRLSKATKQSILALGYKEDTVDQIDIDNYAKN